MLTVKIVFLGFQSCFRVYCDFFQHLSANYFQFLYIGAHERRALGFE